MSMSKKPHAAGAATIEQEQENLLRSLREHGRVIETTTDSAPLPAGVTHILVKKPGAKPQLKEMRKSFI